MLQLRNTPDPDCKVSPAQILFGRPLRDAFSFTNRVVKFDNPAIHPVWREAWRAKETALRTRFAKSVETLNAHAHQLPKLALGDRVFVQNQTGLHPNKWDRSGMVVEGKEHDQYLVKLDGTGRLTLRNRRFLRQYTLPTFSKPSRTMIMADSVPFVHTAADMSEKVAPDLQPCKTSQRLMPQQPYDMVLPSTNIPTETEATVPEMNKADTITIPLEVTHKPQVPPGELQISGPLLVPTMPDVSLDECVIPKPVVERPKRARHPPKQYMPETGQWL